MQPKFPSINYPDIRSDRAYVRKYWDGTFETTKDAFAKALANNIALEAINLLKDTLQENANTIPNVERRITLETSTHLFDQVTVQKLITLTKDEAKCVPFNEWFKIFNVKKEEQPNLIDQNYFNDKMAIIAKIAVTELEKIFDDYKSIEEHKTLYFHVTSSFSGRLIHIDMWQSDHTQKPEQTLSHAEPHFNLSRTQVAHVVSLIFGLWYVIWGPTLFSQKN